MIKSVLFCTSAILCGIAFGQTTQRIPLYETFTSSTCPPCYPGNVHLEELFSQPENEGKFTSIKYQMNWPGTGDPYYTAEAGNRRGFYAVSSVPRLELDGGFNAGPTSLTQEDMDAAYAVPAVVEIDAYYQVNEATKTVDIQISIKALQALSGSGGLFMHVGIFENLTTGNVKTNGETEFEHVMKKLVPTASGTLLGSMEANEVKTFDFSYTFNGTYILPPNGTEPVNHATNHTVEEFSDLGVLVWVQRTSTREVYNSLYAKAGTSGIAEEASTKAPSLSIYPNPSNESAQLWFSGLKNAESGSLAVIDHSGKIVFEQTFQSTGAANQMISLDTKNFDAGLYFVTLSTKEGRKTEKLSVIH